MRVLWHSNAPWCSSGYGVQTANFAPRLQTLGHEVAISCLYGLNGGIINWPGATHDVPCLPSGRDMHGADVVGSHADNYGADVVISHYDAWTIPAQAYHKPWSPWFPVDTEDLPEICREQLKTAVYGFTQSRAGVEAAKQAGIDVGYVPAAYEPQLYYPEDKAAARARIANMPESSFVIGVVAANKGQQPCRKAFPQIFEAFGLFLKDEPGAILYVHTQPQAPEGLDLVKLAQHYGVLDRIRWSNPLGAMIGIDPHAMRGIYNSFDVFLNVSMGEGFGVPILEAQACGVPVIVGDWTAMPEVARSGVTIPKTSAYRYDLPGYGTWYMVEPAAVADAFREAAKWKQNGDVDAAKIQSRVADFTIDQVWDSYWVPELAEMERRVKGVQPNRAARRAAKRKVKLADQPAVA